MKNFKILLSALLIAVVSFGASAGDIFRFGPRLGVELNSMHFNQSVFDSENRAGFTGGLMLEANVPLIGIAFDLSVMYVHRVNTGSSTDADESAFLNNSNYKKQDYIEIPLNFKYRFGLPVVGKIVAPYVFTGPSIAFLTSKQAVTEAFTTKKFDVSWNFGLGVQLFTHLQVGASYGLGITKAVERVSGSISSANISGRNNYWTVTAAWLF